MKIGILGTRGIPNYHGGFEQFAEYFSIYLASQGQEVFVYNSSCHPYKESTFKGVHIIHCYDPENKIGTIGQFIYDFNCILDSRKRSFDIILQLGYTSSSIWRKLLPSKPKIVTNMDGLEWKRSKYSVLVQKFLLYAENLAIKSSDFLISDSVGIKEYLKSKYKKDSKYIAYGAKVFYNPKVEIIRKYDLEPFKYNMLVARLEPENNIETILDGIKISNNKSPFLVVGKHDTNKFGKYLKKKFSKCNNIKFVGAIYDLDILNNLRYFSNLYFHGHSVGGTNPSLLEAMSSNALIVANDNIFNRSILEENALYFNTSNDITTYINSCNKSDYTFILKNNIKNIEKKFNWNFINNEYLNFITEIVTNDEN